MGTGSRDGRHPDRQQHHHQGRQAVAARVDASEFALAGQAVTIHVAPAEPTRHAFHLAVTSETGTLVEARRIRPSGGPITIDGLVGGAHTIDVAGTEPASRSRR